MGLVKGSGEAGVVKTRGDVVKGGDCRHQDAEVGHGEAEQVHVHHTCSQKIIMLQKDIKYMLCNGVICNHRNVNLIM